MDLLMWFVWWFLLWLVLGSSVFHPWKKIACLHFLGKLKRCPHLNYWWKGLHSNLLESTWLKYYSTCAGDYGMKNMSHQYSGTSSILKPSFKTLERDSFET